MRKIVGTVVLVAVVLIVILFVWKKEGQEKGYKIGVVLSLTDKGATFGNRALNGMKLAEAEINERPSFKEKPLRLIIEDSRSSAQTALSALNKLIDIDGIQVATGFVLSDEVLACAPRANERKIVLLTTAAGSDKIKDAGDYIFRNRESGAVQARALANLAIRELNLMRIAVFHSNSANGVSYRDGFVQAAESLDAKVGLIVSYSDGEKDFRTEIQQLKEFKPDAVYLAGLDTELGMILKQSRELAFKTQFLASAGAVSQKLLEIAGEGAEGLICSTGPFDAESKDPKIQDYVSKFKARYGESPDFIAANSYDAIEMIADIFEKGIKSGDGIRTELYNIRAYPGIGGTTTFDSNGEVTKPILMVKVVKAKFVSLN